MAETVTKLPVKQEKTPERALPLKRGVRSKLCVGKSSNFSTISVDNFLRLPTRRFTIRF